VIGAWLAAWLLGPVALGADWRLVAAYDTAAVATIDGDPSSFVWKASEGMTRSCGPAKTPDGLGIHEAEVVASGLSPVLALVIERPPGDDRPLTTEDVRVGLGAGEQRILLHPMVEPRHLAIRIDADAGTERYAQLVRTQIEVETCLEHKTGRGWTGQDTPRLRQAFLLERPDGGEPSRKYFGGQQDPVPALLGPPDACLAAGAAERLVASGRGEGSLSLVPTDVWGATLRTCELDEEGGRQVVAGAARLPLSMASSVDAPTARAPQAWEPLSIALSLGEDGATEEERVHVRMVHGDRALLDGKLMERQADGTVGIRDLLAHVPYRYPSVGPEGHPDRYVVLLVPDWQIVEGLRRLERGGTDEAMHTRPVGVVDGVGAVLAHPELLLVQVRPTASGSASWSNLAGVMRSGVFRGPWGYSVGAAAMASRVVMPREAPPSPVEAAAAQRSLEHALLVGSTAVLLLVGFVSVRRFRDLWARVPHERAHYWPGGGELNLQDVAPSDVPGAEGGE
jgi:hypothetical protein